VVFAQFGLDADIIYEAPASEPSDRRKLFEIPHAREFGMIPAIAPDGRRLAYTALSAETAAPTPESPAELWLAGIEADATPRRLGEGFDLLAPPVWSPDGRSLILRRSSGSAGPYELVSVNVAAAVEVSLLGSEAALFPVSFTPDGAGLYYVALHSGGSDLYRLDGAGTRPVLVSHLSDDLTRDWRLSPAGDRLAFLTLADSPQRISSRVQVLDVVSGQVSAAQSEADEFGPAWSPEGELTFGQLTQSRETTGLRHGDSILTTPATQRGFDVPLAWSRSGSNIAVRTFDGPSVTAPGRATLALLTPDGGRQTIAQGEVTFIGWTYR
jgi:dipeptidyl aminopeptidase/acylaminoacyl peptidase